MAEGVLTVQEAADLLGVSSQRVRQLIRQGTLAARRSSAGWLIEAGSVASREPTPGRPFSARTSWAALRILSAGLEAAGVIGSSPGTEVAYFDAAHVVADRRLRHHVLQLLYGMPAPSDDTGRWCALLAPRASAVRMWAHPGVVQRLAPDPQVGVGGSDAAATLDESLSGTAKRDFYVQEADFEHVVSRYRLHPDPDGQVVMHVIPASVPAELAARHGRCVPAAAAAADLLEDNDPRARRAAIAQLGMMRDALFNLREWRSPAQADWVERDDQQESR